MWARIGRFLYTVNQKDMFMISNTTLGCDVYSLQIKIHVLKPVKNLKFWEISDLIGSFHSRCCTEYQ